MPKIFFFALAFYAGLTNATLPAPKIAPQKIKIVTSISTLGALAREIGGDRVEVSSLISAAEDPHTIKPMPTFKSLVSNARLFIQVGRSLELWLPKVIESSANAQLILVNASEGVNALEVPQALTRDAGDIHPQGNPHIWLSPFAALKIAENIKKALIKIEPAQASVYEANYKAFEHKITIAMFGEALVNKAKNDAFLWRLQEGKKLNEYAAKHKLKLGGWLAKAQKINYSFLTYHTVFSYLAHAFDLKIGGQIEEKAGLEPSVRYVASLVDKAKAAHIKHIVAASYYKSHKVLIDKIVKQIGGASIYIDADSAKQQSYVDFITSILNKLVAFKAKT